MNKECKTCKEYKCISEFHKKKTNKDGLRSECKVCTRARNNKTRRLRLEKTGGNPVVKRDKSCRVCTKVLPYTEYYKCNTSKDGLTGRCKTCIKDKHKSLNNKVSVITKTCSKCKLEKNHTEFSRSIRSSDGLRPSCNKCVREYKVDYYNKNKDILLAKNKEFRDANRHIYAAKSSRRYSIFSQKINKEFIDRLKIIYEVCKVISDLYSEYQVDHIIPLTHSKVCGLNVPWNLQILTKEENLSKSNKFDGTYENESWRK